MGFMKSDQFPLYGTSRHRRSSTFSSRGYRAVPGVQRSKVKDWNIWESVLQIQLPFENLILLKSKKKHIKTYQATNFGAKATQKCSIESIQISQQYPNLSVQSYPPSNLFEVEVSVSVKLHGMCLFNHWKPTSDMNDPVNLDGRRIQGVQYGTI